MAPRKAANVVVVAIFLIAVTGYGVASARNTVADRAKLATAFHHQWRLLPATVEDDFTAHLAARDALITWHGRLKADWLHASPTPKVWLGRDGWLYFNHAAEPGSASPHDPAFSARLDRWAAALSARRAWLASRGIQYLVVAAPDKQTIYPEFLPRVARRHGETPLDNLLARCRRQPGLSVLDLRGPLRVGRQAAPVYLHTDSHWSPAGACVSCEAVVNSLARWYPAAPLPRLSLSPEPVQIGGGDLARMMGLAARRSEVVRGLAWPAPPRARESTERVTFERDPNLTHVPPRVWVNDAPGQPRVLLLGDSFTDDTFCQLLAEDCARLVKVGSYECQADLIEREKPDVVVFEFVERILEKYVPRGPG
jgi:alginate O-acetyltransferase complex protein AlgJ